MLNFIAKIALALFTFLSILHITSCQTPSDHPWWFEVAETARWLSHTATYGTLSTNSQLYKGFPFGNTQSFSDGPIQNGTGHLFFYVTDLDQSMVDINKGNSSKVTFALTEMESNYCHENDLDPESPLCGRVAFFGSFRRCREGQEKAQAKEALFSRQKKNNIITFFLSIPSRWSISRSVSSLPFLDQFLRFVN